jgi:osmotically-inducible protein OsmY
MKHWYDRENRRPSERYDREDYYRNSNPDHYTASDEESSWHFAGKFEDKNDPTYDYNYGSQATRGEYPTYQPPQGQYQRQKQNQYNYGTRERDLMREDRSFDSRYRERHPESSRYYGNEGDYSSLNRQSYDQGYSRSQYGYPNQDQFNMTQRSGDMERNFSGRGPKGWTRSDDNIRDEVCMALERHPRIDASEIEVDVKEGVVTLKGNIHDRPAKRLAEDIVEWLPGVKDINNQLTVDKTFFERAKEFLTGESDVNVADTPTRSAKPERNPRH